MTLLPASRTASATPSARGSQAGRERRHARDRGRRQPRLSEHRPEPAPSRLQAKPPPAAPAAATRPALRERLPPVPGRPVAASERSRDRQSTAAPRAAPSLRFGGAARPARRSAPVAHPYRLRVPARPETAPKQRKRHRSAPVARAPASSRSYGVAVQPWSRSGPDAGFRPEPTRRSCHGSTAASNRPTGRPAPSPTRSTRHGRSGTQLPCPWPPQRPTWRRSRRSPPSGDAAVVASGDAPGRRQAAAAGSGLDPVAARHRCHDRVRSDRRPRGRPPVSRAIPVSSERTAEGRTSAVPMTARRPFRAACCRPGRAWGAVVRLGRGRSGPSPLPAAPP